MKKILLLIISSFIVSQATDSLLVNNVESKTSVNLSVKDFILSSDSLDVEDLYEAQLYNAKLLLAESIIADRTGDSIEAMYRFESLFESLSYLNAMKTTDQLLIKTSSFQHDSSLLAFIIFSFLAGILAILTPCVFPMIPITVSFFINNNKKSTLKNGLIYGLSIVGIFTFVGLV